MKPAKFLHLLVISIVAGFIYLATQQRPPCANSISCVKNLSTQIENGTQGVFLGQTVTAPTIDLAADTNSISVLGEETTADEKHIYIDLDTQTLYAFENNELFFQTLVSTGKWGRTPPGKYHVWTKLRSTRMSGGSGNDYYNLPNVPYVMFFYNSDVSKERGYSLHGAYWHNNFGHEMSHGCVNMRPIDAKVIYDWANPVAKANTTYESKEDPGTSVIICDRVELQKGALPLCLE